MLVDVQQICQAISLSIIVACPCITRTKPILVPFDVVPLTDFLKAAPQCNCAICFIAVHQHVSGITEQKFYPFTMSLVGKPTLGQPLFILADVVLRPLVKVDKRSNLPFTFFHIRQAILQKTFPHMKVCIFHAVQIKEVL